MYVTKLPKDKDSKKPMGRGSLALLAPGLALVFLGLMFLVVMLVINRLGTDLEAFLHYREFEIIMWAFIVPIAIVLVLGIWLGKRHGHEHRFANAGQYVSMSFLALFLFATLFTLFVLIPMLYYEPTWDMLPIN